MCSKSSNLHIRMLDWYFPVICSFGVCHICHFEKIYNQPILSLRFEEVSGFICSIVLQNHTLVMMDHDENVIKKLCLNQAESIYWMYCTVITVSIAKFLYKFIVSISVTYIKSNNLRYLLNCSEGLCHNLEIVSRGFCLFSFSVESRYWCTAFI